MTHWQPMETAPKDGTPILGHGTYYWDGDSAYGWERHPHGSAVILWSNDSCRWLLLNANPYLDIMQPTHWMPLPEPPKED